MIFEQMRRIDRIFKFNIYLEYNEEDITYHFGASEEAYYRVSLSPLTMRFKGRVGGTALHPSF
jgi:hypothetical protein